MGTETNMQREHRLFLVLIAALVVAYVYHGQAIHLGLVAGFYAMYRYDAVQRVKRKREYAIEDANHARMIALIEDTRRRFRL